MESLALGKLRQGKGGMVRFSDESGRRGGIAYIDAARKRPEEFQKRLDSFIKKTRENKLNMGYGGIDKYYRINREGE